MNERLAKVGYEAEDGTARRAHLMCACGRVAMRQWLDGEAALSAEGVPLARETICGLPGCATCRGPVRHEQRRTIEAALQRAGDDGLHLVIRPGKAWGPQSSLMKRVYALKRMRDCVTADARWADLVGPDDSWACVIDPSFRRGHRDVHLHFLVVADERAALPPLREWIEQKFQGEVIEDGPIRNPGSITSYVLKSWGAPSDRKPRSPLERASDVDLRALVKLSKMRFPFFVASGSMKRRPQVPKTKRGPRNPPAPIPTVDAAVAHLLQRGPASVRFPDAYHAGRLLGSPWELRDVVNGRRVVRPVRKWWKGRLITVEPGYLVSSLRRVAERWAEGLARGEIGDDG